MHRVVVFAFFGVFVLQCFANLIGGKYFIYSLHNWSPELWLERLIRLARYTYFVDDKLPSNGQSNLLMSNWTSSKDTIVSATDRFLAFVMALTLIQRYIYGFFSDLCIFSCVITLWFYSNLFANSVIIIDKKRINMRAKRMQEGWNKVYSNFHAVQHISDVINDAIGSQVTLFLTESIIFYSLNLNRILTFQYSVLAIDTFYFSILIAVICVFSADICSQARIY